jgi:N-acetylglutamate synthase-like GNAT family acetyltransferase
VTTGDLEDGKNSDVSDAMTIRDAVAGDVDAIVACVRSAFVMYADRMDVAPRPVLADYDELVARGQVRVADDGGVIAGVLVMWPDGDHIYVDAVAVDPRCQGTGLGTRLLADADRAAREAGLHEVRLCTNEVMRENLEYYPRHGFEETHRSTVGPYRRVHYRRRVTG